MKCDAIKIVMPPTPTDGGPQPVYGAELYCNGSKLEVTKIELILEAGAVVRVRIEVMPNAVEIQGEIYAHVERGRA